MATTRSSKQLRKKTAKSVHAPANKRYVAKEGAPKSAILRCALLNIFFEKDFIEGRPRGMAFRFFEKEKDETNAFHYVEDEDLSKWGSSDIPDLDSIRISIFTQRSSHSKVSRCSIILRADALGVEEDIIKDEDDNQLSQGINVHFDANPQTRKFKNCLSWRMVVKFLQDAAINAFDSNGDHLYDADGHVQALMGRIFVESGRYNKRTHANWMEEWSLKRR